MKPDQPEQPKPQVPTADQEAALDALVAESQALGAYDAKPQVHADPVREALLLAREYVEIASERGYDGTNGHSIRAEAKRRLAIIDAALRAPPVVAQPHSSTMLPRDGGPRFRTDPLGAWVYDEDFLYDAKLGVSGDFGDAAVRLSYAQWIADKLNAAHPLPAQLPVATTLMPSTTQATGDPLFMHADGTVTTAATQNPGAHPAPQPAVADGWVLVPKEPTDEMLMAPFTAASENHRCGECGHEWSRGISMNKAGMVYAAMLAASPQPPKEPPC